ncbi:MAG: single-stranded DNA-binding protein [Armatimonadota bacterium]|nr:single-stranded DNA-binding protein [Armatimonadota bacterium]
MMNVVVLIGRLASDPELKYTPSGVAVATFRIAVDRRPTAEGVKEADFINIVAWRHSAEFAANYLTKGRLVAVEGRLQIRKWVAQDGSKRSMAEVVANDLRGLDRPKEPGQGGAPPPTDEAAATADAAAPVAEDFDPFADE